jgi:Fe-S-cluster-containing dehydrogenase component
VGRLVQRLQRENLKKYGKSTVVSTKPAMPGVLFGYGLDLSRCIGCRRCVHACVKENNQSRDPAIQWIRVLEFTKEKGIDFAEANPYYCMPDAGASPGPAAENKPMPPQQQLTEEQKAILDKPETQYPLYQQKDLPGVPDCKVPRPDNFYVPVSCQQCENPPCVKVCPVKATWKEPDGIVVIDYNWCIGCRYCMAACPYGARHFNWAEPRVPSEDLNPDMHYLGNRPRYRGVVEKCTYCIQRTRNGRYPACVEICPVGARKFGNLLDPKSEIRYILEHKRVLILKNDLATRPKFFYFYGL